MKLFLALAFLLLLSITAIAQLLPAPGKHAIVLLDKELIVKGDENSATRGFKNFYKDPAFYDRLACCQKSASRYAELIGQKFKVVSVDALTPDRSAFLLTLENKKFKTAYYYYEVAQAWLDFPFEVVGGLNVPKDFYCIDVEASNDKLTGDSVYHAGTNAGNVLFSKYLLKGSREFYLTLGLLSDSAMTTSGATVFCGDGKTIDFPEAKVEYDPEFHQCQAFVRLNKEQLDILSASPIKSFRLGVLDFDMQPGEGDKCMKYVQCLMEGERL